MSMLPESQSRNAEKRIISIVRLQNLIGNVSTRELVYILNTYYMRKLKRVILFSQKDTLVFDITFCSVILKKCSILALSDQPDWSFPRGLSELQ